MSEKSPILSGLQGSETVRLEHNKTAPRRCANTVDPRGLADCEGVD